MREHQPYLRRKGAVLSCTALAGAVLLTSGCGLFGGPTGGGPTGAESGSSPGQPTSTAPESPVPPATTLPVRTWPEVFREIKPGVARISVTGCEFASVGTGFLIDQTHVATAAHVVENAAGITIAVNGQVVTATIVGTNGDEDLALLRTDGPVTGHHFTFADEDPVEGTDVGVLGYPQGEGYSTDNGTITGLDRQNGPVFNGVGHFLQTSVTINGGNSGGPLVTLDGDVVGIISSKRTAVVDNGQAHKEFFERTNYASSGAVAGSLVRAWQQKPEPVQLVRCNNSGVPTNNQIVVTVDTPDERGIQVAQSLLIHAQAINGGAYDMAYHVFTPEAQYEQGGAAYWSTDMKSVYWHSIDIADIRSTGPGSIIANVSFKTTQDASQSLGGSQTCSIWHMQYTMIWASVWWEISAATPTTPTEPC